MDSKFAARIGSNRDYQAIVADLAKLRSDMTQLANHLANHLAKGSASAVNAAQAQLTAEANRLMDVASMAGKSAAKSVEAQLGAHPARSVMLAFALGFVNSRLLSH